MDRSNADLVRDPLPEEWEFLLGVPNLETEPHSRETTHERDDCAHQQQGDTDQNSQESEHRRKKEDTFWKQVEDKRRLSTAKFSLNGVTEHNKGMIYAILEKAHFKEIIEETTGKVIDHVHQSTERAMLQSIYAILNENSGKSLSQISRKTWQGLEKVYRSLCGAKCAKRLGKGGPTRQAMPASKHSPPNRISSDSSDSQATQLSPRTLKDEIRAELESKLDLYPAFSLDGSYIEQVHDIKYMTDGDSSKNPRNWFEYTGGRYDATSDDCSGEAGGRQASIHCPLGKGKEFLLLDRIARGDVNSLVYDMDRTEYLGTRNTETQLWLEKVEISDQDSLVQLDRDEKKLELLEKPSVAECLLEAQVGQVRREVLAVNNSATYGSFAFYDAEGDLTSPIVEREGPCGVSFRYFCFERKRVNEKKIESSVAKDAPSGFYPTKASGCRKGALMRETRSWFLYGTTKTTTCDSGKTVGIVVDNSQVGSKRSYGQMKAQAVQTLGRESSSGKCLAELHLERNHHSEEDVQNALALLRTRGFEILAYRVECLKVVVAAAPHKLNAFCDELQAQGCLAVGNITWNVVSANPASLTTDCNILPVEPCTSSSFCGVVRESSGVSRYIFFRGMEENSNPRFAGISDRCVVESFEVSVPERETTRIEKLRSQGYFQVMSTTATKQNHVTMARDCFQDHGTKLCEIPEVIQLVDHTCSVGVIEKEDCETLNEDMLNAGSETTRGLHDSLWTGSNNTTSTTPITSESTPFNEEDALSNGNEVHSQWTPRKYPTRSVLDDEDRLLKYIVHVNQTNEDVFKKPTPFMTFVMVGSQSSGKSSFVERCLGQVLNIVDEGTATRCPLHITVLHDDLFDAEPSCDLVGPELENPGADLSVKDVFQRITAHNKMLKTMGKVSKEPLKLVFRSSKVQNMRLVDMPGLKDNEDSNSDDREAIQSILRHEMKKPNTKLCVLLQSTQEFATQPIIRRCDEIFGNRREWVGRAVFVMAKGDLLMTYIRSHGSVNRFFRAFHENGIFPHLICNPKLDDQNSLTPQEVYEARQELLLTANESEEKRFNEWENKLNQRVQASGEQGWLDEEIKQRFGFDSAQKLMRVILLEDTHDRLPQVRLELCHQKDVLEQERVNLERLQSEEPILDALSTTTRTGSKFSNGKAVFLSHRGIDDKKLVDLIRVIEKEAYETLNKDMLNGGSKTARVWFDAPTPLAVLSAGKRTVVSVLDSITWLDSSKQSRESEERSIDAPTTRTVSKFSNGKGKQPVVFLSHSGIDDKEHLMANVVYEALMSKSLTCFLNSASLCAGQDFQATITSALVNSRIFVVFLSPSYFRRELCMKELDLAMSRRMKILPIYSDYDTPLDRSSETRKSLRNDNSFETEEALRISKIEANLLKPMICRFLDEDEFIRTHAVVGPSTASRWLRNAKELLALMTTKCWIIIGHEAQTLQ